MKATRVNPGALSPMEMNNMSSMMGMMNSIQKIGKGKRKYTVKLDKTDKKLLVRFINEAKKQFTDTASNSQYAGVYNFLTYITDIASKKESTEIKMSYEDEKEYIKKVKSSETSNYFVVMKNSKIIGCIGFNGNTARKMKHYGTIGISEGCKS